MVIYYVIVYKGGVTSCLHLAAGVVDSTVLEGNGRCGSNTGGTANTEALRISKGVTCKVDYESLLLSCGDLSSTVRNVAVAVNVAGDECRVCVSQAVGVGSTYSRAG